MNFFLEIIYFYQAFNKTVVKIFHLFHSFKINFFLKVYLEETNTKKSVSLLCSSFFSSGNLILDFLCIGPEMPMMKYLLYLKFIFHFHCLILVQPSLIHPQTIRTAFQLVPPLALDPPFPIHPTYFVSGTLPKIPLSLSSSREVQQLYHFKSRFPSILLNLTSLVLNILFL